jgi:hypothetical protein
MFERRDNGHMAHSPAFAHLVDLSARFVAPASSGLSDAALMETQRQLAEFRRRSDAWSASVAAEIAYRSRRELGDAGLARRLGTRTPELLVQHLAGTTLREAHTMVRVGTLMTEPSSLSAVGSAVADGSLSFDAADVIRAGLSGIDPAVPERTVVDLVHTMVRDAPFLTVEKLAARTRERAADLDEAHVVDRERAMREARYLRITPQSDGMTRLSGLLDPESAAVIVSTFDAITSPRRGGPRFVDPAARDYAERLSHDERTTDQLTADAFVELVRLGATAAPGIVGAQRPAVRVLVTDRDLARRAGHGEIEGQTSPISIGTVDRQICDRGALPIQFDHAGQVVNLGRTQRRFTSRQKTALAARDGGCRFPDCSRPPSWTEAHHINHWQHGGRSDVADGVLLCRHHHLLLHDNGWQVVRDGATYFLIPPRTIDPEQQPILAPPKTGMVARMLVRT